MPYADLPAGKAPRWVVALDGSEGGPLSGLQGWSKEAPTAERGAYPDEALAGPEPEGARAARSDRLRYAAFGFEAPYRLSPRASTLAGGRKRASRARRPATSLGAGRAEFSVDAAGDARRGASRAVEQLGPASPG